MVKNMNELERIIQEIESEKSQCVDIKHLDSVDELQKVLTNKNVQMQYGWVGSREHNREIMAIVTTADNIVIGTIEQIEYLNYGELVDSSIKETESICEPEATYKVLVREKDLIDYHKDYMYEENYTLYYYNVEPEVA